MSTKNLIKIIAPVMGLLVFLSTNAQTCCRDDIGIDTSQWYRESDMRVNGTNTVWRLKKWKPVELCPICHKYPCEYQAPPMKIRSGGWRADSADARQPIDTTIFMAAIRPTQSFLWMDSAVYRAGVTKSKKKK